MHGLAPEQVPNERNCAPSFVRPLRRASTLPVHMTTVNVLGVGVTPTNLSDAIVKIINWIAEDKRTYVCVTGVHGIMESQRYPEVKSFHNAADMVVPDGMPLVYVSRIAGHRTTGRVYGPDLMLGLLRRSVDFGHRHYLCMGLTPETSWTSDEPAKEDVPRRILKFAGTYAPAFSAPTTKPRRASGDRADQ